MSGLDEKAVLAACEAYHADLPTHDPPSRWAMEQAISAYLAAATPADVGELVERTLSGETVAGVPVLGWMWEVDAPLAGTTRQTAYHWSTPPSNVHVTRLVDATALERITRERDEAHELKAHARKCCDEAEAKLAEARKVVERFARLSDNYANASPSDAVFAKGSVFVSDIRAARRWIEETK